VLKAIYNRYRTRQNGGLRSKMLKMQGWMALLDDAGFIDDQFPQRWGPLDDA
jgi:hypothetical protein